MAYLLDTNILSEPIRREPHPLVMQRWRERGPDEYLASVITLMELRFGAAKSARPGVLWGADR